MINDTLDGGYLSKDASVRTLEYATERILEILEEAGQQNNSMCSNLIFNLCPSVIFS